MPIRSEMRNLRIRVGATGNEQSADPLTSGKEGVADGDPRHGIGRMGQFVR